MSYEAYTNDNGIAEFTLLNGQTIQQKVVDLHTNAPIAGVKAVLFVNNNGDSTIMLFDKNDVYSPAVNSYQASIASSSKAMAMGASITAPLTFTVGLITYQEARLSAHSSASGPTVPLTQSVLPEGIDVAFVNKYFQYKYTTSLEELSNITPSTILEGSKAELVGNLKGEVDDIVTTILINSGMKVAEITGKVYENINPIADFSEAALNAQLMGNYIGNVMRFKLLGYPSDTVIDVYEPKPDSIGAFGKKLVNVRIMVPKSSSPIMLSGFGSIFGNIINEQGQPIPSAAIKLVSMDSPPTSALLSFADDINNTSLTTNRFDKSAVTDGLGYYAFGKFPIPGYVKTAWLQVTGPGYDSELKKIPINTDMTLKIDFTLKAKKGRTVITVKDSSTQQPLGNAIIRIYNSSGNGGYAGDTSDDGTFNFSKAIGTYRIVISKSGYIGREYNFNLNEAGTPLNVVLDQAPAILPDLTVSATVNSNYTAGQIEVQIPVTVSQSGGKFSYGSNVEVGIYWSDKNVLNSAASLLWHDNTNYTIDSLNTNGSNTVNADINIPSASTGGTYFLILVVDPNNYYRENNKTNNIRIYPVTIPTPPSNIPPICATNLIATALSSNKIALFWSDNSSNETGFKIERKIGINGIYSLLTTVGSNTIYFEDNTLAAGTQYFYRVRAYNSYGDSTTSSNEASAITQATTTVPTAATNAATGVTSNSVILNGSVNPNGVATGAFFQYGTSLSYGNLTNSQIIGNGASNVSVTASLTGLSANTTYHFRIVAANGAGGTTFGGDQTFTTGTSVNTTTVPSMPTANSPGSTSSPGTTISSTAVTLGWSAVSGATYYDFGVRDMTTNQLVVSTTSTGTSYSAALSSGKQYRWNVAACNSAGCSSYTAPLYFQTPSSSTPTAPAMPTANSPGSTSSPGTTTSSTTAALSWSAVSGATYYDFGVRDMTTNTLVVSTTSTGTSYSAALSAGKQYRWNVAACNSAGCSSYTTPLYFQTPSSSTPTAPAMPTANSPGSTSSPGTTISSTTAALSWSAVSGATYYDFGIRDMTTNQLVVSTTSTGTSYSAALSSGKQYRWNVAACNSAGCSSYTVPLYFQTPATTVTPSVSSLSPTSMTASTTALTTLTVNGSNFSTSGGHLQFTDPFGTPYSSASHPERVVSVTSTKWVYQINNGGTVGTWWVQVVNSDGRTSNATAFTVY